MSTRKASFIAGFFFLVIVLTFLPGARHLLAQDSGTQERQATGLLRASRSSWPWTNATRLLSTPL